MLDDVISVRSAY